MCPPALRWIAFDSPERAALVELRREVLRRPLGLDFTAEQLAAESDQLHLGAWDGVRAVGALLLAPRGAAMAQMRQVAVAVDARRRGVGRLLVGESEARARREGWTRLVLHARRDAEAFYARLGYQAVGEPYVEIGLAHVTMTKELPRA